MTSFFYPDFGGGVSTYANVAALPATATTGALAVTLDTYSLYIYETGPGWVLLASPGGGGAVSSVSNSDGTLTVSPTTGAVVASLNLAHANTWTADQTFQGSVLEDGALGAELVVNGTFTGSATGWTLNAGWAYNADNVQHSSNGTGTLTPTTPISITAGLIYRVQFTMSTMAGVTGTCTVSLGGVGNAAVTAEATTRTHVYTILTNSTSPLVFTPSNTARFTIDDISVKQVLGQIRSYRDVNISNIIAATPAVQQQSPYLRLIGQGWKTTATAASQQVEWRQYVLPVQGSTNPTSQYTWQSVVNGTVSAASMLLDSVQGLSVPGAGASSQRFGFSTSAAGTSALAVGFAANASGASAVAIGTSASASGSSSTGVGTSVLSNNTQTTAVGASASATNSTASSFGFSAAATGNDSTALGSNSTASGSQSIAVGKTPTASATGAIAVGNLASASTVDAIAIGHGADAGINNYTIAIGRNSVSRGTESISIGVSSVVTGDYSIAIGEGWSLSAANQVCIGQVGAAQSGTGTTIINGSSSSSGGFNTAIGYNALAAASYTVAIGNNSQATDAACVALGYLAVSSGTNSLSLGTGNTSSGAASTSIGVSTTASGDYSISMGVANNASANTAIAIGYASAAGFSNAAVIGNAITATGTDQITLGYSSLCLKAGYAATAQPAVIHSADIQSGVGNTDQLGSDLTIQTGLSTGTGHGGDFVLKQSPATLVSSDTQNAANEHIHTYAATGVSAFIGEPGIVLDPTANVSAIAYQQGGALGYTTDGSTTRQYIAYSYKTLAGTKVFSTPGFDLGTFTDDNSTVSFIDTVTSESATENSGITGYVVGDVVDYLFYSRATVNGNDLFSLASGMATVTIAAATAGVDLSWTAATFPAGSIPVGTRILRQVNSGGFVDFIDIVHPTATYQDDNTVWATGSTITPTTVQNYYQINLSWTAAVGFPDGYLIYRIVNGGSPDATDVGNLVALTDTGTLPWAASTTITPTTALGFRVELADGGFPLSINRSDTTLVYRFPAADGTANQVITTNGAGTLSFGSVPISGFNRIATATNYTTLANGDLIAVTDTSAPRTITLATGLVSGSYQVIKDESGGATANAIIIAGSGGQLIDGAASISINIDYGSARVYFNGANWFTY